MPEEVSDILFGSSEPAPKSKPKTAISKYVGGIETRLSDVKLDTGMDDILFGSHSSGSPINIGKFGSTTQMHKPTSKSNRQLDNMMDDLVYGKQDKMIKYQKPELKKKEITTYTERKPTVTQKQLDKMMGDIVYGDQKPELKKKLPTRKQKLTTTQKQLDKKMDDIAFGKTLIKHKPKQKTYRITKSERYGL
jgi:hypothetical protein